MGSILLLIDNSNIYIGAKNAVSREMRHHARFNYSNLEAICAGNDTIIEKHLFGSTPPASDSFWLSMERKGYSVHTYQRVSAGFNRSKEKSVDVSLAVEATSAIERLRPDRVVLLSGDRDFVPLANLRDGMKSRHDSHLLTLDIWSFADALSSEIARVSDRVFRVDDYIKDLVYFRYENGTNESFTEYEERLALEEAAKERERAATEAAKKERIAAMDAARREQEATKAENSNKAWGAFKKVAGVVGGIVVVGATIAGGIWLNKK